MCKKCPSVSVRGINCEPMPSVLVVTKEDRSIPWYSVEDKGQGVSGIVATDKNGMRVSFALLTDSESMKNLLACDPFGENLCEVIKNKIKKCT